jgi:N-acetylglucosamine-6-phosphate deacetylase
VILVTDVISAAGQPPGEPRLGELMVRLDDTGRFAVPEPPNLAGSALSWTGRWRTSCASRA